MVRLQPVHFQCTAMIYYILALVPILILVVVSLWKNLNTAVLAGFLVTAGLFFFWGSPVSYFFASLVNALFSTITIVMIVVGAIFLYRVMEGTGYIRAISGSLQQINPAREISFFLIAIGLTAFFEGVAGFGTPGTIVPLLLIALGFDARLAVAVVLLMNGVVAIAGAVGTPVLTGLEIPLGLARDTVSEVYLLAGIIISLVGLVVMWFVVRLYGRHAGTPTHRPQIFMMYAFFAAPLVLFAWLAGEFSIILAALCMLILSGIVLKKGKEKIAWKPWLPYLALIVLLLLPRLIGPLQELINRKIAFTNLWSTGINAAIKPLVVPLIPFVTVGLGVMLVKKSRRFHLSDIARKVLSVFLILFPAIAISQLMVNSDAARPSMVTHIATMFQQTGSFYVLFAPLLGVAGAFITGSTTVSNLVFGAAQRETAQLLSLSEPLVLAMQLCGASLGNSVCLFNIIAAATVANVRDYKPILKDNLVPAVTAALLAGLGGMALAF